MENGWKSSPELGESSEALNGSFPGRKIGFRRSGSDSVPSPNGTKFGSKVEHLEGITFSKDTQRNSW